MCRPLRLHSRGVSKTWWGRVGASQSTPPVRGRLVATLHWRRRVPQRRRRYQEAQKRAAWSDRCKDQVRVWGEGGGGRGAWWTVSLTDSGVRNSARSAAAPSTRRRFPPFLGRQVGSKSQHPRTGWPCGDGFSAVFGPAVVTRVPPFSTPAGRRRGRRRDRRAWPGRVPNPRSENPKHSRRLSRTQTS